MPLRISALLLFCLPAVSLAQSKPCAAGETSLTRDPKGEFQLKASPCHDVALRAHFLGSRGTFRTALTFDNPSLSVPTACPLGKSCLKHTAECATTKWLQGGYRPPCKADQLTDPTELNCACQAPDAVDFSQRALAGKSHALWPTLQIDRNGDGTVDDQRTDAWLGGGKSFRAYSLFPTLTRLELEDKQLPPDGDFNDYVAAVETIDCDPTRSWPPQTADFGSPERPIRCVDGCATNPCDKALVAPQQGLRFQVALGIDDTKAETDRESRGRKLHLTVATYTDLPLNLINANEQLAVCPVLWLDWRRPRASTETTDLTQRINYGRDSSCAAWSGYAPGGEPICPKGDASVQMALPISLSTSGATAPCDLSRGPGTEVFITRPKGPTDCGPKSFVHDYELSLAQVDAQLSEPALHYGRLTAEQLGDAVVAVELMVFRELGTRLLTLPGRTQFHCPSGVNALVRAAPDSVSQVTSYRFNPPGRPDPTPGFSIYIRQ